MKFSKEKIRWIVIISAILVILGLTGGCCFAEASCTSERNRFGVAS